MHLLFWCNSRRDKRQLSCRAAWWQITPETSVACNYRVSAGQYRLSVTSLPLFLLTQHNTFQSSPTPSDSALSSHLQLIVLSLSLSLSLCPRPYSLSLSLSLLNLNLSYAVFRLQLLWCFVWMCIVPGSLVLAPTKATVSVGLVFLICLAVVDSLLPTSFFLS